MAQTASEKAVVAFWGRRLGGDRHGQGSCRRLELGEPTAVFASFNSKSGANAAGRTILFFHEPFPRVGLACTLPAVTLPSCGRGLAFLSISFITILTDKAAPPTAFPAAPARRDGWPGQHRAAGGTRR